MTSPSTPPERTSGTTGLDADLLNAAPVASQEGRHAGSSVAPDANGWLPIETAPRDESEFLAFGSYWYPGDKAKTSYTSVVSYSGFEDWPWTDGDGNNSPDVFSHWQPLPKPPVSNSSRLLPATATDKPAAIPPMAAGNLSDEAAL